MMKMLISTAIGLALVAGSAAAKDAATARLSAVQGSVMVNQGSGFVPASDKTVLHAGDRLMSLKGGKAHILFANGCDVALSGGAAATIAKPAAGHCASNFVSDKDRTSEVGGLDMSSPGTLIPIVIVVAGAGVGIYEATKSTSP